MIKRGMRDPREAMMYAVDFDAPLVGESPETPNEVPDDWLQLDPPITIEAEAIVTTRDGVRNVSEFDKEELNDEHVLGDPRLKKFKFNPDYSNPYPEFTDDPVIARLYKQWRYEEIKLTYEKERDRHKEAKKKTEEWENKNKILFFGNDEKQYLGKHGRWGPNPGQVEFFRKFREELVRIKTWLFTGGNRSSKSFTFTGIVPIMLLLGHFPWEDPKEVGTWIWDALGWKAPIRIRIVGQDWMSQIKTAVLPTLKDLIPEFMQMEVRKNSIGVDAYFTYPTNGSTIEVMSNNSEAAVFEGASLHAVCYDEPPTRDVRIACARGLVDTNGFEFFAMTLLKEAWVDKEVINRLTDDGQPDPSVYHVHVETYNNMGYGITQAGIDNFIKSLRPEEVDARIRGVPAYKAGLILRLNRKMHYIDAFSLPGNWPIDVGIDIGIAKPHDILYLATSEMGRKYVIKGDVIKGDGAAIADSIVKYMTKHNLRLNRVIVDPLAKADKNNENSTYEKIDMHLNRFGYYLETGTKDKEDGIQRINDYLSDAHGSPSLFIFKDVSPKVIRQLEGLMFDDNGKPSKEDDDAFENLYRLMLLDTKYSEEEIDDIPKEFQGESTRNKVTGY